MTNDNHGENLYRYAHHLSFYCKLQYQIQTNISCYGKNRQGNYIIAVRVIYTQTYHSVECNPQDENIKKKYLVKKKKKLGATINTHARVLG